MSRIGKKPVLIPSGITVEFENQILKISNKKEEVFQNINELVSIKINEHQIIIERSNDKKATKAYHGLVRALIQNMIIGITQNFSKLLIAEGVGYKFQIEKNVLSLSMGFSHPIQFNIPKNIAIKLESPTRLLISGIDKQEVGFFAAKVRNIKPPEPYKGKGIRYENEKILRKAGKTRK